MIKGLEAVGLENVTVSQYVSDPIALALSHQGHNTSLWEVRNAKSEVVIYLQEGSLAPKKAFLVSYFAEPKSVPTNSTLS